MLILFAVGSTGGSFLSQQMLLPWVDKSPRNATSRSLSKFGIVSIDPHVKIIRASIFNLFYSNLVINYPSILVGFSGTLWLHPLLDSRLTFQAQVLQLCPCAVHYVHGLFLGGQTVYTRTVIQVHAHVDVILTCPMGKGPGACLSKPRKLIRLSKPFLVNLYLKTERCTSLKPLVWREPSY